MRLAFVVLICGAGGGSIAHILLNLISLTLSCMMIQRSVGWEEVHDPE